MGKTVKAEWSKPDGMHTMHRLERKARPAGRLTAVIDQEMEADAEDVPLELITFEPATQDTEIEWEFFCCWDCHGLS